MATKEEILDAIANMSVLELSELLKDFEEKFGVTAAASRRAGSRNRDRSRSGDLEGVLELLHELGELDEGHLLEGLEQVFGADLRHDGNLS